MHFCHAQFAPRNDTFKKQAQLEQRETELRLAIKSAASDARILKAVAKYRAARLSLLKATLHVIREMEWQKKPYRFTLEETEVQIALFSAMTDEEIIHEVMARK